MFNLFSNDKTPNFHPVTSAFQPPQFFGPLEPQDTDWACSSGFATETQVWYNVFEDGVFMMCQVIYSSVGILPPQVQFTCKVFDPATKDQTWRSVNISKFTTPPPPSHGRTYTRQSSKSDKHTIIHSPASASGDVEESYKIDAVPSDDVQIAITITRPAAVPGHKFGVGPKGGFSYFGTSPEKPEGLVIHRFWPRTACTGVVTVRGRVYEANGTGMFVHAIQGMRPNLVAERWNFAHFMSPQEGGVSAVMMEFTTTPAYGLAGNGSGQVKVNVGSVVVGGKLALVTGETGLPGQKPDPAAVVRSRATHLGAALDQETGYKAPARITFEWAGPAVLSGAEDGKAVEAELKVDLGSHVKPTGLLEKVDVLAELPFVVRKMVNFVGTKPYIYQYFNPCTLSLKVPPGLVEGKESLTVEGTLFNEATFISNP